MLQRSDRTCGLTGLLGVLALDVDRRDAKAGSGAGERAGGAGGDVIDVDPGARQGELRAAADEHLALEGLVVFALGRADDLTAVLG